MTTRLVMLAIALMFALVLIPPLFFVLDMTEEQSFTKSFNLILFALLTLVGVLFPYLLPSLPKEMKRASLLAAGWFCMKFIYDLANIYTPEAELQAPEAFYVWIKYALCFMMGLVFIIAHSVKQSLHGKDIS